MMEDWKEAETRGRRDVFSFTSLRKDPQTLKSQIFLVGSFLGLFFLLLRGYLFLRLVFDAPFFLTVSTTVSSFF